jgi:fructose/tagatose bisphosphate aldolase
MCGIRSINSKTWSRYLVLTQVEAEVFDIQRIYEENQFLKNMNEEIKKRVEKKQAQLGPMNK